MRKILENMNLKIKNEVIEYFIYIMKNFNDENASIYELNYDNIFKLIKRDDNEDSSSPHNGEENAEEEEVEEDEDEDEAQVEPTPGASQDNNNLLTSPNNNNDDEAIEITPDEYFAKVNNIIKKICLRLNLANTKLDEHFEKYINIDSEHQYRGIELGKLVQILNEEFNLILSPVDIYCIFTKLKPGNNENEQEEGSDEHINDEFVDYDKLIFEVNDFLNKNREEESNNMNGISKQVRKLSTETKIISNFGNNDFSALTPPKDDFIQLIKQYLQNNNITYEKFIFLQHPNMELIPVQDKTSNTNSSFNRVLNIKTFEQFLLSKNIVANVIYPNEKNKLKVSKNNLDYNILFHDNKINIDYLKNFVSNDSNYKSIQNSDKQLISANGTGKFNSSEK